MLITRRAATSLILGGFALPTMLRAQGAPAGSSGAIVSRIVLEDGRIWVGATIGSSEPLLFILDTGAYTNVIRPEIARRLKLEATGGTQIRGVGKDAVQVGTFRARNMVIGGTQRVPEMLFNDYAFGNGIAADAAGLLSAALITTFDSELDFTAGTWSVWPRGRGALPTGFVRLPSTIDTPNGRRGVQKIHVTGYIDGKAYRLLVDTGAPNGITILPQAARASGLYNDSQPYAPLQSAGFGGRAAKLSRQVRAKTFQLGDLSVDRPIVSVMAPDQDQVGQHEVDGIVGLPILSLFTLATQIRGGTLWVKRNATAYQAPTYRRSGVWLENGPGGIVVADVGRGSAAAAAGLQAGDRIEAASFNEAIRSANPPPGTTATIKVRRGGEVREIRFTPADYL